MTVKTKVRHKFSATWQNINNLPNDIPIVVSKRPLGFHARQSTCLRSDRIGFDMFHFIDLCVDSFTGEIPWRLISLPRLAIVGGRILSHFTIMFAIGFKLHTVAVWWAMKMITLSNEALFCSINMIVLVVLCANCLTGGRIKSIKSFAGGPEIRFGPTENGRVRLASTDC